MLPMWQIFQCRQYLEGFNIRINGADFEQIISRDGKIVHPLTDKTVKVSYVITKEETGEELVTDDFTYTIAGQHTTNAAKKYKAIHYS